MPETGVRKHKDKWKNISKHFNDMKEGEDISFDQLLTNLSSVGKSHLTKALNQAALKYYNTKAGDDFHQIKVILLGAN